MAKLTTKGMVGIALGLSLTASGLVYSYLQRVAQPAHTPTVPVIVAKTDIPSKTKVTADMVLIKDIPAEYLQPGAVSDRKQVIGVITREHITAGEQVTGQRLLLERKAAGLTGVIPPGKRAVTIAVNDVSGVGGMLKPGDYVDVMATFDQGTAGDFIGDVVLQDVKVLAVNRDLETGPGEATKDKKEAAKSSTVTLAIDAAHVHHVAVAEDRGKIRLALRPFMDETGFILTQPVTARKLAGKPEPAQQAVINEQPSNQIQLPGRSIQIIRGAKVETVEL